jgi:Uma2 family endonuclease
MLDSPSTYPIDNHSAPTRPFISDRCKGGRFLDGAPIFAAEIRSENDYGEPAEQELAQKRADYFACGTLVVWDVDVLRERIIRVYRAGHPDQPTIYRSGDLAEAEPALPGWTMAVDDLLP